MDVMKITADYIRAMKGRERIASLTAYDFAMTKCLDSAGVPLLLVGDSLGMVMLGYPDTTHVTMEDMEHHGRAVARAKPSALLAVDLPFVESRFLEYLIASACQCAAVVTVPRAAGGWQPLCAVYRREFAAVAERALRKGKNRIDALFSQVETRGISEEELMRMGFSANMFRNLNTPVEWQKAAAEFESQDAIKEWLQKNAPSFVH